MILLIFLILTGCAVKCDDRFCSLDKSCCVEHAPFSFWVNSLTPCISNNYYVIQMVDDYPEVLRKPFRIYWNVPTMQCKSKKIPFDNLYEKYGIIQNRDDSFRGEKISILYDPGNFPALLKNDTSGKYEFRNGGVPQEGNLDYHLAAFKKILEQSIPDSQFSGIGIIDFESWRPIFRQNFGALIPYKDVSYQIERNRHWMWPSSWIQSEAKKRFQEHARVFMETTIATAKAMRPQALWGYYGFPYCFNMASNNMIERCADSVPQENDYTYWLWKESTALYPSLYSSKSLTSKQLSQLIRGRVKEAGRVKSRGAPILPYFWYRYRDGGFLSEDDLQIALNTIYQSDASGIIIWGSSSDVNTVDKCLDLYDYINKTLGPLISKYTRLNRHHAEIINDESENENYSSIHENIPETTVDPLEKFNEKIANVTKVIENITTNKPPLKNIDPDLADPDFEWNPPENYTQDIIKYVQDEFNKKNNNYGDDFNYSREDLNENNGNKTILKPLDESKLIELMVQTLIGTTQNPEDMKSTTESFTDLENKFNDKITIGLTSDVHHGTSENIQTTTETFSTIYEDFKYNNESTINETDLEFKDDYNVTDTILNVDDYLEVNVSTTENFESNFGEFKYIESSSTSNQNIKTTEREDIIFATTEIVTERIYNKDENKNKSNAEIIEDYLDITLNPELEAKEETTSTNIDYVDIFKNYSINNGKYSEKVIDGTETVKDIGKTQETTTKSSIEQVTGSARYSGPKYYCLFFYFFSVSRCLCDYYGQC